MNEDRDDAEFKGFSFDDNEDDSQDSDDGLTLADLQPVSNLVEADSDDGFTLDDHVTLRRRRMNSVQNEVPAQEDSDGGFNLDDVIPLRRRQPNPDPEVRDQPGPVLGSVSDNGLAS